METIELVVYFTVAIMLGGVILAFITGLDPGVIYSKFHDAIAPNRDLRFEKIDSSLLASRAFALWDSCALGQEEKNVTLYVDRGDPVDQAYFFSHIKKFNLCYTMQSASQGCGDREDVTFTQTVTPPALVTMRCDVTTQKLVITPRS